jgi:hypothetical protein
MSKIEATKRIETIKILHLPNEQACNWLESNSPKTPPSSFSDFNQHKLVSWVLARRPSAIARLTVATHGTHVSTLRRLYNSGSKAERIAALSNIAIGPLSPDSIFDQGRYFLSFEMVKTILHDRNTNEFQVLLANPFINRGCLADLLEGWDSVDGLTDEIKMQLVLALTANSVISTPHDDTYLDGYAEYSYNRLNFCLADLLQTVPVNRDWASVLSDLLGKLHLPYKPKFEVDLLERWQSPAIVENGFLDYFEWLRKEIVSKILNGPGRLRSETLNLEHPDPAVRQGLYASLWVSEIFKISRGDSFEYPAFRSLNEDWYELNAEQQAVVDVCNSCFEKDNNAFIQSLMQNKYFWMESRERTFLNRLCWDLAEDPHSDMDMPNEYRSFEIFYQRENPEWFADENYVPEFSEDVTMEDRIDQIRKEISDVKHTLSGLEGDQSSDEFGLDNSISLASILERQTRLEELLDRRLRIASEERIIIKGLMWVVTFLVSFVLLKQLGVF